VDYLVAASCFLALALLYVGGRHFAVQLDRRIFQLEERRAGLRESNDVLAARVNALGNRARVSQLARTELGMTTPKADAYGLIYYVPEGDVRAARIAWWPRRGAGSRR
jgi:cell division protein FtsL